MDLLVNTNNYMDWVEVTEKEDITMPKLNKAEKFVKRQFELGKTLNQVRVAIFEKLYTWNFPPEYINALTSEDPTFDGEPLKGTKYLKNELGIENSVHPCGTPYSLDEFICTDCGQRHELCFCHDDLEPKPCQFCPEYLPCVCETIRLPKLPDPRTKEWESMVDFMRADLETNMAYSKIIAVAEKLFADRGQNLYEEFEKDQRMLREDKS